MSIPMQFGLIARKWKSVMSDQTQAINGSNGNGRKGLNWSNVSVVMALVMATYSIAAPATSTYQERKIADERRDQIINQILDHQKWQDAQYDKLTTKVDKQADLLNSINLSLSVVASRTEWMAKWVQSGGQQK